MIRKTNHHAAIAGLWCVGLALLSATMPAVAPGQPNIIHIIADDFGWTDLSSGQTNKGNGSTFYQTPNIDQLAAEGMAFTSAYAVQTCVPTRVSVLTGQYATRTGVYNVQSLNVNNDGSALVGAANSTTIDTSAVTIGETLQAAGYTTAHFGKFHVTQRVGDITTEHGFDYDFGGSRSGGPGTYFATAGGQFDNTIGAGLDPYAAPYTQAYVDTHLKPYANGADVDSLVGTNKHLTDATTDAALDFIGDRLATGGEPFYMNLAFNAVHTPVEPRPDLEAKYAGILSANGGTSPDSRHDNTAYAGLVEGMDQSIGRLAAYLNDPNGDGDPTDSIAEETVLLFYGDNGGATQATDNTPLRLGKGSQYEGGLRVPLIAWSPGRIASGAINDEPVHSVDFYPTFAELAGASLPSAASQPLDGQSLTNVLTGQTTTLDRDAVFFHFPGYQGQLPPTTSVVLNAGSNRYKLMYFYEGRDYELYDLNNDLSESNDLAEGNLSVGDYKLAARAVAKMRTWLDDTGALYPTVRDTGSPVPAPQHLPSIAYDLGINLDGLITATQTKLGVTLSLSAVGDGATFDADTTATGIASSLDTGGPQQRRRINGTLSTPEAIHFSFDTDVMLKSLSFEALNTDGTEAVLLSFIAGDNPFVDLEGYTGNGFTLGNEFLAFNGAEATATDFTLPLGILGRDEIFLSAGTVLAVASNPSAGGGFLLSAITIAQPLAAIEQVLLDYNLDGVIDSADYNLWRTTYGSTDDLRADGNGDGVVDAADYTLWRKAFVAPAPALSRTIPEPHSLLLLALALALLIAPHRGRFSYLG